MKRKLLKRGWFGTTVCYIYLTVLSIIAAFPLVWILLSSVKGKGEITGDPTAFFPKAISFENFRIVFQQLHFGSNIINSIIIAGCTTLIAIMISALGAYGVVRFFPRVGKIITRILITTYMFPPILLAVPYSIIIGKVGMMNNRIALIIVYLSFSVPYAVWLLVGFFQTVPIGIEEAARVDGAIYSGGASHRLSRHCSRGNLHLYQRMERIPLLSDFDEQQFQNDGCRGTEIPGGPGGPGLGRYDGSIRPRGGSLGGILHADSEKNRRWSGCRFC